MPDAGPQPLRLLLVTGSPDDADLIVRELQRGGFAPEFRFVDRESAMRTALAEAAWDAVVSEYAFGSFAASSALGLLKELNIDLPFIIVSDPVGEEKAIALMRAGAHDFVSRDDLARLPTSVRRELAAARDRRHHAEDERRAQREFRAFQSIADNTSSIVARFDRDLRHLYVNKRAAEATGLPTEQFIGKTNRELGMPEPLVSMWEEKIRKVFETGSPETFSFSFEGPGGMRYFQSVVVAEKTDDGKIETVLGYNHDVTDQRRAAEALAYAQRIARVGSWELDLGEKDINKNPLRWSDEVFRIFGLEPGGIAVTNDNFFSFVPPEDRARIEAAVADAVKLRKPYDLEHEVLRRDGSRRWVRERGDVVVDASGTPVRILGTVQDVTEKHDAETALLNALEDNVEQSKKLQEREALFRSVFENAHDLVHLSDRDGKIKFASPSFTRVLGYDPKELVGTAITDLVHPDDRARTVEERRKMIADPSYRNAFRRRMLHKDGTVRVMEVIGASMLDVPEVDAIVFNSRDVTDVVAAESATEAQRAKYRTIVENSLDVITVLNADGTVREDSPSVKAVLGYEANELRGRNVFEFVHPDDRAHVMANFKKGMEDPTQTPLSLYRFRHKDGTWRTLESAGKNLLADPTIAGILINSRDVTARIAAESARAESDRLLSVAMESMTEAFYIIAADYSKLYYINPAFERIWGIPTDALYANPTAWSDSILPEDRPAIWKFVQDMIATGKGASELVEPPFRVKRSDGKIVWLQGHSLPLRDEHGAVTRLAGSVRDITAQKEAELAKESLLRQQTLILDSTTEGIVGVDAQGRCTFINGAAARMFGGAPHDFHGKVMHDLVHQKHADGSPAPRNECPILHAYISGRSVHVDDDVMWRLDGTSFPVEYSAAPIVEGGANVGAVVTVIDATTKRVAAETRARLAAIAAASDDAIIGKDLNGIITSWNQGAERMYGYTAEEAVGKSVEMLVPPDHPNDIPAIMERIRRGENVGHHETKRRAKDGRILDVLLAVTPVRDESGRVVAASAIGHDNTERKRSERQLLELAELKNKFIQIVSHQFRTPLNAIRWNLETLLAEELGPMPDVQKQFIRVTYQANVEVIKRIRDLLTAIDIEEGRVLLTKETVSLESLWGSVLAGWKKDCAVKGLTCNYLPPTEPLPATTIDPDKIRIAFEKLTDNAVAYTAEGGMVSASLRRTDGHVRFEVKDNGVGIPKVEQPRLFQRFFRATNAPAMKPDASGLGLPIAKYFVEQHGGTIGFESEEGKGSTFWFEIPITGAH